MTYKILHVDDEASIRLLVKFNLEQNGYEVLQAKDGQEALDLAKNENPDLILLDLLLPKTNGLDVCLQLKQNSTTSAIPIIMLTAKKEEVDKVIGLELGADDYLTKPFGQRELLARVKAVLRRSTANTKEKVNTSLNIGQLSINTESFEVLLASEKIALTPKEFDLLVLLITNATRAFTREQLLEKVWGYDYYGDSRTVDVHIRHLRSKLSADEHIQKAIQTVHGVGYRFSYK